MHIANDFGQLDVLLTLQQAERKIYSLIADTEKREIANNNYLVKRRKIKYIKDTTEINKKVDVLLVSCINTTLENHSYIPDTVIFLNVENTLATHPEFNLEVNLPSLKVLKRKK